MVKGQERDSFGGRSYHDQSTILVRLLGQSIQLGDGIVEGLFGEVARSVGGVQDLVVEDGEIEGETEADLQYVSMVPKDSASKRE
jgi:hypothetical protein